MRVLRYSASQVQNITACRLQLSPRRDTSSASGMGWKKLAAGVRLSGDMQFHLPQMKQRMSRSWWWSTCQAVVENNPMWIRAIWMTALVMQRVVGRLPNILAALTKGH